MSSSPENDSSQADTLSSEPSELKVKLATNLTVEQVASHVSQSSLDWGQLETSYRETIARLGHPPFKSYVHLSGFFLETHVHNVLRSLSMDDLNTDPIPDGAKAGEYTFYRDIKGQIYVKKATEMPDGRVFWHDKAEYDDLIVAGGLPTVIEAKVARRGSRASNQIIRNVQAERIEKKLEPLKDYFQTDQFGYIIFTTPEAALSGERVTDFTENGGIIAPFNFSYNDFHKGALDITKRVTPHIIPKYEIL